MKRELIIGVAAVALCAFLSGCESLFGEPGETISFNVLPETAVCGIRQNGRTVSVLRDGGGYLTVPKGRRDMQIECVAPGYQRQTIALESSASGYRVTGCTPAELCRTQYVAGNLNPFHNTLPIRLAYANANMAQQSAPQNQPAYQGTQVAGVAAPRLPTPARVTRSVWHTTHNNAKAYWGASVDRDFLLMPSTVPLTLVRKAEAWGLFAYQGADGRRGQVWISLQDVTPQT
jgi:hypothetical protein